MPRIQAVPSIQTTTSFCRVCSPSPHRLSSLTLSPISVVCGSPSLFIIRIDLSLSLSLSYTESNSQIPYRCSIFFCFPIYASHSSFIRRTTSLSLSLSQTLSCSFGKNPLQPAVSEVGHPPIVLLE